MRILFDHNIPSGLGRYLTGHTVISAKREGWERLTNGDLLTAAQTAGFDVLLTADKNMRYQQNLTDRKIAIVVLGNSAWRIVQRHADRIASAVSEAKPGSYSEVEIPFRSRS